MASSDTTPALDSTNVQSPQTDQPYEEEHSHDPRPGGEGRAGEEPAGGESGESRGDALSGNVPNNRTATEMDQREEARPAVVDGTKGKTHNLDHMSSPFWQMYLAESKEEDKNLVENITTHTNGVLVFTGLFGAIVAAFIIESYKQLQPDSGSMTVTLLAQISQQIADSSNGTHPPTLSPLINVHSASFRPTPSAVRVNAFWFLSLLLSLSCALAATLMQQWARRYVSNTQEAQRAGTVQSEGLIHAYLFFGMQSFRFKAAIEALPVLLHTSVVFFFVGLIDFLFPINNAVAYILLALVVLGTLIYLGLTVLPIICPNSPYATPLSPIVAYIVPFAILIHYAFILLQERLIHLATQYQRLRLLLHPPSHPIQSAVLFLTAMLRDITLVPGGIIIRFMSAICHTIAMAPSEIIWFMERRIISNFHSISKTALGVRKRATIYRWRYLLTISTRKKLHHAASSPNNKVEPNALMWTLATVMDDDAKLGKCLEGYFLFIQHYWTRTTDEKVTEIVSLLRNTDGLETRLPSVLRNIAVSLKSVDKEQVAELRERAKSCLALLHMLMKDRRYLYQCARGMPKALSELRQDTDPDLAVSATCTSALFHFHYIGRGFLAGPADDTPPDEADLKDVKTIWATNAVDEWNVRGAIAFVSFTQSVLPHLKYAAPESIQFVWKTFGYGHDASRRYYAADTRDLSWNGLAHFPVGGDLVIEWRKRPHWWDREDPKEFAKLVSGLRRLRTTILDAGWPDPLDAHHPVDPLPKRRDLFAKLYNNLRQLYRFFAEYEDLVRAAANPAPIESLAGPSTSPPKTSVHSTESDLSDDTQDSDTQSRSAVTIPLEPLMMSPSWLEFSELSEGLFVGI